MATTNENNGFVKWVIRGVWAGLLMLSSYVAVLQNLRVQDIEKVRKEEKDISNQREKDLLKALAKANAKSDSLQGLRIIDNSKSFEELKEILDIKSNRSTITIKPKK